MFGQEILRKSVQQLKEERRQKISVWTGDIEEICLQQLKEERKQKSVFEQEVWKKYVQQLKEERRQKISVWTGDMEEICPTTHGRKKAKYQCLDRRDGKKIPKTYRQLEFEPWAMVYCIR